MRMRQLLLLVIVLLFALHPAQASEPVGGGSSGGGANEWNSGVCTPISTSSFSVVDNTSNAVNFAIGRPIRYGDVAGTWNYGLVTNNVAAAGIETITIGGAPMDAAHDGLCQWGLWGLTREVTFSDPGQYSDGADAALLLHDLLLQYRWRHGKAYLVRFSVIATAKDTGANNPRINMVTTAGAVSTSNANAGIEIIAASWTSTIIDINTTNYVINFGDTLECSVDANGTNKDGVNMSVQVIFVLTGKG